MPYGFVGSMRARPGRRGEVVAILLEGTDGLRAAGCSLYAVGVPEGDPDLIMVTEIWESKKHHDDSLHLPETKAAIARAMPLLTGEFSSQEMTVLGGLGV
ncbi:putative quinol monooxygenase [Micromonospora krabiensis]|uniref:Quinol monooxygenase YgiN n=1 Tax=Micromonospora krabiensis TaxID=307121 RepID=A0A1C3N2U9_9ACTN|nr:antibiotic biosynthesis monooxygenase [Micromonospora krabiensis]SBV26913.1 Quinol monooxygenase YgiN [Micromonospora krabiensis]